MAVLRAQNWLSQQRIDLSHLRSIESAVAGDFDSIIGRATAGSRPQVVRGFEVSGIGVGAAASSLELSVADGMIYHLDASESGSFLWVPEDRVAEVLNPLTNGTVTGSWTSSSVNYVGVDFSRTADADTTDLVQFLDANNLLEVPRSVPLAKTLDYVVNISTIPFSSSSNLVPVAIVTLDSSGLLTAISDARPMLFRLGGGGDVPNIYAGFAWEGGRAEGVTALTDGLFIGGDKALASQKDWQDAVMTRLWEQGGGEFWYSAAADRNVNMVWTGATFTNGENFEWVGAANLHWKGIKFIFDNSTGYYNTVSDQVGNSAGLTDLADGECIYVDVDRTSNATVAGVKAVMSTLGPGAVPGSRWIMAWRLGASLYTRNWRYPVGTTFTPATTTSQGVLKLTRDYLGTDAIAYSGLNDPYALSDRGGVIKPPDNNNGIVVMAADAGDNDGVTAYGTGTGTGISGIAGATGGGYGVYANGGAAIAAGVYGIGGATGGVAGLFSATTNADAVQATGAGTGHGGRFSSGATGKCVVAYGSAGTVQAILDAITATTKAQAGTTTNHPFNFITNNAEVWSMTAAGVLTSIGGPRAIQAVLDPVTAQDAATLNYIGLTSEAQFNHVINGGFDFWQRNTTAFHTHTSLLGVYNFAYVSADRWYLELSDSDTNNSTLKATLSRQNSGLTTSAYKARIAIENGTGAGGTVGIAQEIDRHLVTKLRGKKVTLALKWMVAAGGSWAGTEVFRLRVTTGNQVNATKYRREYSGTVTELCSADVDHTGGTGPMPVALTQRIVASTVIVPTDATTMAVSISVTGVAAGMNPATSYFEVAEVQLLSGAVVVAPDFRWSGPTLAAELYECLRYYEKSYEIDVPVPTTDANGIFLTYSPAGNIANGVSWNLGSHPKFQVTKQYTPYLIALYPYDTTSSGYWNYQAGELNSLPVSVSTKGFEVGNNSGGAAVDPGAGKVYGHWAAAAEYQESGAI